MSEEHTEEPIANEAGRRARSEDGPEVEGHRRIRGRTDEPEPDEAGRRIRGRTDEDDGPEVEGHRWGSH